MTPVAIETQAVGRHLWLMGHKWGWPAPGPVSKTADKLLFMSSLGKYQSNRVNLAARLLGYLA